MVGLRTQTFEKWRKINQLRRWSYPEMADVMADVMLKKIELENAILSKHEVSYQPLGAGRSSDVPLSAPDKDVSATAPTFETKG